MWGEVTFEFSVEQGKIVVIGKGTFWESVLQVSDSLKQTARLELISDQCNTKEIKLVLPVLTLTINAGHAMHIVIEIAKEQRGAWDISPVGKVL